MKLPKTATTKHCYLEVLKVFPNRVPEPLMLDQLDEVKTILAKQANIICESYAEVMGCLEIWAEQGLLQILEFVDNDEKTFRVGNLYNGI